MSGGDNNGHSAVYNVNVCPKTWRYIAASRV